MTDSIVLDLGFETAGHILETVTPRGAGLAATDLGGRPLWTNGVEVDLELGRRIRELLTEGLDPNDLSHRIGSRGSLVMSPILSHASSPVAWLIAWSEEIDDILSPPAEWKRLTEMLPRVAVMLTRECGLASELSGAVIELGDRYEELNVVYRMEREVRDATGQANVVQSMLRSFVEHIRIDFGLFLSADEGLVLSARGGDRPISNLDLVLTELRVKVWRFISASKQPLVINDRDDDRRQYLMTNMPFKLMAIPGGGCEEVEGGLLLIRHVDEPDFTNSDMSLARVFFGQAMILMRNQNLLSRMERFTRQIASSLVETVEAKDPYTRGHSERVETITSGLGRAVGIDESDYDDLLWGALLHDIGKIGIPDAILMKPGRLTADEYNFIKTHPARSYDILRHVEQLGPAALDGARYHQERFDGAGYPFGLRGEEIPLAARIVAVSDTYDAVTSSRSYRAAMSHDKAMEIVLEASGSQLDPQIVREFARLVEEDAEWLARVRPSSSVGLDG